MAGLAHLSVGLAAKRVSPRIPLPVLILSSYAIDAIFGVFLLLGLEQVPRSAKAVAAAQTQNGASDDGGAGEDLDPPSPWSHGLFMATIWSALAGVTARQISGRPRTGWFIGLLVFSHWVIDFITQPMRATFPRQSGIPLFFHKSRRVGLGVYSSRTAVNVGEYGSLALGTVLYLQGLMKLKRENRE